MPRRAAVAIVGITLAVAFAVGWWSLGAPSGSPAPVFDVAAVRALATAGDAPLPERVEVLHVADAWMPHAAAVARTDWVRVRTALVAHRVVYADHTGVIDPVADEVSLRAGLPTAGAYDPDAWERLVTWLDDARWIAATHEHFDHLAGLASAPGFASLAGKARLLPAQITGADAEQSGMTADRAAAIAPLPDAPLHRLDAGVVLIPAPGHTPGSALIYTRTADGRERLFVGDIAWNDQAIALPRGKPRLVSFVLGEDAARVADQLAFLHALRRDHPEIAQVVAHDEGTLRRLAADGVLAPVGP